MWMAIFQSTRPVRGRDLPRQNSCGAGRISIHAPRAGARRESERSQKSDRRLISIHAPRAGARPGARAARQALWVFQSTRPVRGRDSPPAPKLVLCGGDISIHAPRAGARRHLIHKTTVTKIFQSTRPVRGRDCFSQVVKVSLRDFNPRAPCGGATHR